MAGFSAVVVTSFFVICSDASRLEFPPQPLHFLFLAPGGRLAEPPFQVASLRASLDPSADAAADEWRAAQQGTGSGGASQDYRGRPSSQASRESFGERQPSEVSGQPGQVNWQAGQPQVSPSYGARGFSTKAKASLSGALERTAVRRAEFENLDDDIANVISDLVKRMVPTVEVLNFGGNHRLSTAGWTALFSALAVPELRLQRLSFTGCNLDDLCAAEIGDKLAQLGPTVKSVDLSGANSMSPTGWKLLLTPLTRRGSCLEDIRFSGNDLEDIRANAIAMQLMYMGPTIKTLHFSGNTRLSSFGWTTLLRPMTGAGSRFEDVRFGDCDLDDEDAKTIFTQLVRMGPTLRKMDFEGNPALSPMGWVDLLSPLSNYRRYSYLEEVSFGACDLDDVRAEAIGSYLNSTHPRVKVLDFADNSGLSLHAWEALLRPVTTPGSGLTHVGFAHCQLGEAEAAAVAACLSTLMPIVRRLRFRRNSRLTPDGWVTLLGPLSAMGVGVEELDVDDCDLDDASAAVIGEQLDVMDTSVKKLYFGNNPRLSSAGWLALLQPLTRFSAGLEEVNFQGCDLDDARAALIGEQLGNLVSTLRKVSFTGNRGLSEAAWLALILPLTKFGGNLEEIDFSGCGLDAERARAIGQSLVRLSPAVKRLSFKGMSMLTAEGWHAMLQPLTWDDPRHQVSGPGSWPRLL